MHFSRVWILILAGAAAASLAADDEVLHADGPHPRIFLNGQRLRRLRRERDRESMRWNQFHLLMAGKAPMPEPGFAAALYYQVAGDKDAGAQAVTWALGPGADLRQLALVFDWCQDILTEGQSKTLAAKLVRSLEQTRGDASVSAVRSRLLAAVALDGHVTDLPQTEFDRTVRRWWREQIQPAINGGREAVKHDEVYALMETLHAVRDNFNIDLREGSTQFFTDLPAIQLLSYYPATFPAGENDYRIPASARPEADPDLRRAALSRSAELAMVAYDSNAPGSQFLQGWLTDDHFLLRGTFGAPYEFLWANPYQPGLSYTQTPLAMHDSLFGRLFARSSWEESAAWLGCFSGVMQIFHDGAVALLDPGKEEQPLDLGSALIVFGAHTSRFKVSAEGKEPVFVAGLAAKKDYLIEVDDEEVTDGESDSGGILPLDVPHGHEVGVRIAPVTR